MIIPKPSNNTPLVSIIIPVFNGEKYIRDAVKSVLNQTYKEIEIIVVDDGSTDQTSAILEPWIKDGAIHYVHQTNKGGAVARNVGIRLAKGEFLKFLDSDDYLFPQQLEIQVNHLKNKPNFIISITDYKFKFENNSEKNVQINLGNGSQLARLIYSNIGPIHSFLTHRSIIEKIGGFDEELTSYQDSDLWLRALIQGCIFEKADYTGCCYRILKDSISSNPERQIRNCFIVNEKLNKALLPKLDQLPNDVLEALLWINFKLIHICFIQRIKPITYLPTALKVSRIIYLKTNFGLKKALLNLISIQNIILLVFIKSIILNFNYYKELDILAWRKE